MLSVHVFVLQSSTNYGSPVWRRVSTQGLRWWKAQVTLVSDPTSPVSNIVLEGVVGGGENGDIIVDDMDVSTGACSKSLVYRELVKGQNLKY